MRRAIECLEQLGVDLRMVDVERTGGSAYVSIEPGCDRHIIFEFHCVELRRSTDEEVEGG